MDPFESSSDGRVKRIFVHCCSDCRASSHSCNVAALLARSIKSLHEALNPKTLNLKTLKPQNLKP